MSATLSAKGQTTIDDLNTTVEDWGLAPYKAPVQELRTLLVAVKCAHCSGKGMHYGGTYTDESGVRADMAYFYGLNKEAYNASFDNEWSASYDDFSRNSHVNYGVVSISGLSGYEAIRSGAKRCQTCTVSTAGYKGRGYNMEYQEVLCNIHRPAWPVDTKFDSRFQHHDCELCGKNNITSGSYAVLAIRPDGTHEGMFVGNACVKKLGFKAFKTIQQVSVKNMENRESNRGKLDFFERTYQTHEDCSVVEQE